METKDNKTYIAITLGPISRIASYAEDTKGIWASSYLFSYIAKHVIKPFNGKRTFLLPTLNKEMDDPAIIQGAGVYPDRYVFESQIGDFEMLCKNVQDVYTSLAKNISDVIKKDIKDIEAYLRRTIKVYAFERSFKENEDVVKDCENRLGYMECQDLYPQKEPINYLRLFFERVKDSFLVDDGFGSTNRDRLFETIIEYAAVEIDTNEFWKKNSGKVSRFPSKALVDEVKLAEAEKDKIVKPYHKYIVFVKADGDNMTETIKGLQEQGRSAMDLSKALFDYNKETIRLISAYGGRTLFLGGDDLLFFAPVRNGNQTIFSLLAEIEQKFMAALRKWIPDWEITLPTLSFGVSITYYKHPMFEAYQKAEDLLRLAKSGTKNRIAWYLRKHSGQVYQSVVLKEHVELYEQFKKWTTDRVFMLTAKEDYLSSFTYWLEQNRLMLEYILSQLHVLEKGASEEDKVLVSNRLSYYLDNSFDEPNHNKEGIKGYKKALVDYLIGYKNSYGTDTKTDMNIDEDAINSLYATLRFVKFLISDQENE